MTNGYKQFGIRIDGSEIELECKPNGGEWYLSKDWCFSSATKNAIGIRASGNPENLSRIEVRDQEGKVYFKDHPWLLV